MKKIYVTFGTNHSRVVRGYRVGYEHPIELILKDDADSRLVVSEIFGEEWCTFYDIKENTSIKKHDVFDLSGKEHVVLVEYFNVVYGTLLHRDKYRGIRIYPRRYSYYEYLTVAGSSDFYTQAKTVAGVTKAVKRFIDFVYN